MADLWRVAIALTPWVIALYGIAFLSGGVYYLEQRVTRIKDQLPERTPLARLYGALALIIGALALASAAGHLVFDQSEARLAALVAVVAGVGFWVHRLRMGLTLAERIRAGAFALVCTALAVAAAGWIRI